MSIDRSLKTLKEEERWKESDSLLGLPKVAHRKSHAGRKEAKEKVAGEVTAVEGQVEGVTAEDKES
jgi:hypothetical protein